jgi:signal transduction histidine kinase
MTPDTQNERKRVSPANRLGILYVASFCSIVLISALSQTLILRELSWQSTAVVSVGRFARERWLDRPLSIAALELMAAETGSRSELERQLRRTILESQTNMPGTTESGGPLVSSRPKAGTACSQLLERAEMHGLAARESAEALLALFEQAGSSGSRPAGSSTHLQQIITEEEAAVRAVGEAAQASAQVANRRIDLLETFEFVLFGLVLIVLMLEGFLVISPAVVRIRRFMGDLEKSHEDLKAYARKLERSNSELQDFASVASHDLQEPLRKVQAFSDRLKTKYASVLDEQGRDYLERVQNAAGRMQTLINDLLTYSRVATKAKPFVPTNVQSITREVISDLEARIEQVNGKVEVGELPTLDADPLQVRQLMQNLIGNSLKYRKPDVPPIVRVSSRTLREDPAAGAQKPSPQFCQILVEDNGIGFEEIYAERIFTIFQRLHGRSEYEGTGVGLAVCRKIVERHGGTITARSKPGEGSTFLVNLPVRQLQESGHDGSKP